VNLFSAQGGALLIVFAVGAAIGSLLNVCIYRLPRGAGFWSAIWHLFYPPSHCPGCNKAIAFRDNIPILGWLLLAGRCRNCHSRISVRYPLVELLTAMLFVGVYWLEVRNVSQMEASSLYHLLGPTGSIWSTWMSPEGVQHWRFLLHACLIAFLVTASAIDLDLGCIPDTVTLPGMAIGILANTLIGQAYLVPVWYQTPDMAASVGKYASLLEAILPRGVLQDWVEPWLAFRGAPQWIDSHPHLHGLILSLAGVLVGGGSVWCVRILGRCGLGREAMGFGDVVLMAMIGSFLGWQAALLTFTVALILSVVVAVPCRLMKGNREFPFGPFLALGALSVLVAGGKLLPVIEVKMIALGPLLIPAAAVLGGLAFCLLVLVQAAQNRTRTACETGI
jgi:leader peptidase (prepilin peptidase) / N-methyltransferase